MSTTPFNVSARAAILIGRENISNTEGAIIELVKNSYDADADYVLLIVDNYYTTIPERLSKKQHKQIVEHDPKLDELLKRIYIEANKDYIFSSENLKDKELIEVERQFTESLKDFCTIYIVDNGSGMSMNDIQKNWMTIGTSNKKDHAISPKGRVKSGAKGIGRFALDKLGRNCEIISLKNDESEEAVYWKVDWSQFEKPDTTIDNVKATLETFEVSSLSEGFDYLAGGNSTDFFLESIIKKINTGELNVGDRSDLNSGFNGTIIKITNLHEKWDSRNIKKLFKNLEVLIPPKDINDFSIYLLPTKDTDNFGEVPTSFCDEFDYKLTATSEGNGRVSIFVEREEYDVDTIPEEFLKRESVSKLRASIISRRYETEMSILDILGPKVSAEIINQIGSFEFILYFMKKVTTALDKKRFFYKNFSSNDRKQWLESFGGIKIYRDGFRVRPYGEVNNPSFDWLGLGQRKASSPAGVAKGDGGYKVEPENVSGIVKISRLTNIDFQDKSSREGMQESEGFKVFQSLLKSIISVFEKDRAAIASELKKYDDERYGPERDLEKAQKIAENIIKAKEDSNESEDTDDVKKILAYSIKKMKGQIETLENEQIMLRAMASSGITSAALSHDMEKIKGRVQSHTKLLKDNISSYIREDEDFGGDIFNPYIDIESIEKDNDKIFTWLGFSLEFIKKDKRKRKKLNLNKYFNSLASKWKSTFEPRGISVDINIPEQIEMRLFEVDFDSIFINLFVNSIEAFDLPSSIVERKVSIKVEELNDLIVIEYRDTGPGISSSISNVEEVFSPQFSTKRDEYGDIVGTGLGMWIIKNTVADYRGKVSILNNIENGFGFGIKVELKK